MPRYNAVENQFIQERRGGDLAVEYPAPNGAISPRDGAARITFPNMGAAYTLAPPALSDEGMQLRLTQRYSGPNSVTIPEGFGGRAGIAHTILTFEKEGATISLAAENGHWVPIAAPYEVTITTN